MIILVGASASGKTEAAKELGILFNIKKAITTTTRKMRVGEKDGVDYFFLTKEEFLKRVSEARFVENAQYAGNYYGCGKDQVAKDRVLIVEPNGLHSFKALNDDSIVTFFINVSEEIRAKRMLERGDKEEDIKVRLERDRIDFSKEKVGETDFVIDADSLSIVEVSKIIFDKYQKSLLERGY